MKVRDGKAALDLDVLYAYIKSNPDVISNDVARHFDISVRTARNKILTLILHGAIEKSGTAPGHRGEQPTYRARSADAAAPNKRTYYEARWQNHARRVRDGQAQLDSTEGRKFNFVFTLGELGWNGIGRSAFRNPDTGTASVSEQA